MSLASFKVFSRIYYLGNWNDSYQIAFDLFSFIPQVVILLEVLLDWKLNDSMNSILYRSNYLTSLAPLNAN
jgi:hypothetical protein